MSLDIPDLDLLFAYVTLSSVLLNNINSSNLILVQGFINVLFQTELFTRALDLTYF